MEKFGTIVIDPPWEYRNKKTGGNKKTGPTAGASQHYPTMSIGKLMAMKLPAKPNCLLFLWATTPLIHRALFLMDHWGFYYRTTIYWIKERRLGLGYWFRGNAEVCYLGTKGNVDPFRSSSPNVIHSIPRRHSEKPEEFFKLIEPHCLEPKLEIFARKKRPGWKVYGNEVDSEIEIITRKGIYFKEVKK